MWKEVALFLFFAPASVLTGGFLFWRKWHKYPTGAVVEARGKREERNRVKEAEKELKRLENS